MQDKALISELFLFPFKVENLFINVSIISITSYLIGGDISPIKFSQLYSLDEVKANFYKAEFHVLSMDLDIKKLTPQERYELIGKLIEEIKLRKYSYQTGKAYISL